MANKVERYYSRIELGRLEHQVTITISNNKSAVEKIVLPKPKAKKEARVEARV